MLGIIRVLTTDDSKVFESHGVIIKERYGIHVKSYCIPDQPYGIHDEVTETAAIPKIITLAKNIEADGVKAILISCAADPGLQQVRASVHIPVIGAGTCAAALALTLGKRVGVLNLTGHTPSSPAAILGERQVMEVAPEGVDNTTDLMTPSGKMAAIKALGELAAACDVIMLACTGFATIHFAEKMRKHVPIPIVDAIEASGAVAQLILRNI
ncbi:MAG: aspartate/glutamate racemase family protein [Megasphaera sp.]|jgi:Asp/Glu/hydantoin racemase|uniref:aspartate/glutamate racemase family protein n=1 Tax=Megasphaera sueciensis TaxID=349094 RepID=UPI003D094E51|nr:aspartate/glutamate racemase family protein [Megasphaera sp.]MCI1822327.1 aspartate/glutamate racemase family protein [Megasphaera sp.]